MTVDIVDVFANAVKVAPETVSKGDLVFDAMGRTYPVKHVTCFNNDVRIIREDGVRSWHDYDSTITIVRKA